MNQKNNKNMADWKDYSEFEFLWLEIMLTQNILKKEHLVYLLKKMKMEFTKKNWETKISRNALGLALLADVPKNELFPKIKNIINNYPTKFSFKETEQIYNKLSIFDFQKLIKIYIEITKTENLQKKNSLPKAEEFNEEQDKKNDILRVILIKLIKIPKSKAKRKINKLVNQFI